MDIKEFQRNIKIRYGGIYQRKRRGRSNSREFRTSKKPRKVSIPTNSDPEYDSDLDGEEGGEFPLPPADSKLNGLDEILYVACYVGGMCLGRSGYDAGKKG